MIGNPQSGCKLCINHSNRIILSKILYLCLQLKYELGYTNVWLTGLGVESVVTLLLRFTPWNEKVF